MKTMKKNYKDISYDELYTMAFEEKCEVANNKKKIEHTSNCIRCHMRNAMLENPQEGIIVCKNCGYVSTTDMIDNRQEWKSYEEDCKKFCQMNDADHKDYDNTYTGLIKKLHRWTTVSSEEKSIHIVLQRIHEICETAKISKCIEDDAKIMYKAINEYKFNGKKKAMRSRNRSGTIVGGILHACKRKGEPRSPKELAQHSKLRYSDVTKGYKTFLILLKLIDVNKVFDVNALNTIEQYVSRYCVELKIDKESSQFAIDIANNIRKLDIITDHIPSSIAAGCLLIAANLKKLPITKKFLESKFNISVVTISKTYKEITTKKYLEDVYVKDIITNNDLTDYYHKLLKKTYEICKMNLTTINEENEEYVFESEDEEIYYKTNENIQQTDFMICGIEKIEKIIKMTKNKTKMTFNILFESFN